LSILPQSWGTNDSQSNQKKTTTLPTLQQIIDRMQELKQENEENGRRLEEVQLEWDTETRNWKFMMSNGRSSESLWETAESKWKIVTNNAKINNPTKEDGLQSNPHATWHSTIVSGNHEWAYNTTLHGPKAQPV